MAGLVSKEEAERIGREVRKDFLSALEETRLLGLELDRVNRALASDHSPEGREALRRALGRTR